MRMCSGVQQPEGIDENALEAIWNGSPCEGHEETRAIDSREISKLVWSHFKGNRLKELGIDQARGSVFSNDMVIVVQVYLGLKVIRYERHRIDALREQIRKDGKGNLECVGIGKARVSRLGWAPSRDGLHSS